MTPRPLGQAECMKILLESGAEVLYTCEGSPPLHMAVACGQLDAYKDFSLKAVQLLLQYGASLLDVDDREFTPLHVCAELGLAPLAEELLKAEGGMQALSSRNGFGALPLHVAAGRPSVLKVLLEWGADTTATTSIQRTALHEAAYLGCEDSVLQLLASKSPPAVAAVDEYGCTAAALALRRGFTHISDYLEALAKGESVDMATPPPQNTTFVIAPPGCHNHVTHPIPFVRGGPQPPPENDKRLDNLTHPVRGVLRSTAISALEFVEDSPPAPMADILRCHDYSYVKRVQEACALLDKGQLGGLDGDTVISEGSFQAARYAAGAVLRAVDAVVLGEARHAFCAVRPPGHHAGPSGLVISANEEAGSHGFCLLSNVAIGAAYARCVHRDKGIHRVALLDFDVHHGNGTQACVAATVPTLKTQRFSTPVAEGLLKVPHYKPWLDLNEDKAEIFLAGTQGYGNKGQGISASGWFYPGSGGTFDTEQKARGAEEGEGQIEGEAGYAAATPVDRPFANGPRVVNVGIPGPGACRPLWRRAWCTKILPALHAFKPDLIMISAGFDAHIKDDVNCGYVGIDELDYQWVTDAIVQIANEHCAGRVVSVLEGGYRIQGGVVSAFSRSAAAHVAALSRPTFQVWSGAVAAQEMFTDRGAGQAGGEDTVDDELRHKRAHDSSATLSGDTLAHLKEDENEGRRKRRRDPVDYAALNEKLEAERLAMTVGASKSSMPAAEVKSEKPADAGPAI